VSLVLFACSDESSDPAAGRSNPQGGTGSGGSMSGSAGRAQPAGAGGVGPSSGGTTSGGSSSGSGHVVGGSGGTPSVQSCSTVGETVKLGKTVSVSGTVFDGKCKRYISDGLGDGSQKEGQQPLFELSSGATLINVVLGAPAADGIHTTGDVTLKNITWQDIGEDAMTVVGEGTVVLDGGSAQKGADKVFQINAPSTFKVSNFVAKDAGKFIRQNGDTEFLVKVFIEHCDISDMKEAVFRTDSSSSTVSMTNSRYSDIGVDLFMGVEAKNITEQNNEEY
jgi:pectate lyase C